jgi:hypothetical protein
MEKHNINNAFLNCSIFSVHNLPVTEDEFYMVENVYYHNSLTSGIVEFKQETIQIPEYEIQDLHLLNAIDFNIINQYGIPILKRNIGLTEESWKIDLTHYDYYKLQSNSF